MTPKMIARTIATADKEAEIPTVEIGDQVLYWIFNPQFYRRFRLGTVCEIGETSIGGRKRKYYAVAECPQLPILEQQIERIVNKVSKVKLNFAYRIGSA